MKYDIGIYDINGYSNLNYKERIAIYKNAGFKEMALYLDDRFMKNGENYEDIISYAKNEGLQVKQVHIDYKQCNLICDENDNTYFNYVEKKANECRKLKIPYMVLHASIGDNPPKINENQLQKLKRITQKYQDVTFCFENVKNNTNLERILYLDEPNIKMCYDLGHAHAYSSEIQLFEKLKDYIICSHLNNNYGSDDHNVLNNGEIDYKDILKKLLNIKNSSNCLEVFPHYGEFLTKEEFEKFIQNCIDF